MGARRSSAWVHGHSGQMVRIHRGEVHAWEAPARGAAVHVRNIDHLHRCAVVRSACAHLRRTPHGMGSPSSERCSSASAATSDRRDTRSWPLP
eukprot:6154918-Prymnesium_polylepis.1